MSKNIRHVCPVCRSSEKVVPILHGEPTALAMQEAHDKKLWLGGCLMQADNPHWYYLRDENKF